MNRREARKQAFLFVFEHEFHGQNWNEMVFAKGMSENVEISGFAERVFCGIQEHKCEVESLIEQNLLAWSKDRLSKVTIAILRVAVYEILFEEGIPVSVSINEAVELAKRYGTEDDAAFVNGVLGSIAKQLAPENDL